jgi:hypothetical protein
MKIRTVEAELFYVDERRSYWRTENTKTLVVYRNFANAPKNKSVSMDMTCGILHTALGKSLCT